MPAEQLPTMIMITMLVVVLLWEMLWPRRPEQKGMGWRWANNLSLTLIGQAVAQATAVGVLLVTAWWADHIKIGMLADANIPWMASFIVFFLAMEFIGYALHVASHKIPWLWRLHSVHHSDTELDFTSSYRHHPLELIITAFIPLPFIVAMGAPVSVAIAYQVVRTFVHLPAHGNVYVPEWIHRAMVKVFVTPDFHRLHHCSDRTYTDSNYGTVLTVFDYAFGTATHRPFNDHVDMQLGLEYFRHKDDSRLDRMLLQPFTDWDKVRTRPSEQPSRSS